MAAPAPAAAARLLSVALLAQLASPPCVAVRLEARFSLATNASNRLPSQTWAPTSVAPKDAAAGLGTATSAAASARRVEPDGLPPAISTTPKAQLRDATARQAPARIGGGLPCPLHRLLLLASGAASATASLQAPTAAPVRAGPSSSQAAAAAARGPDDPGGEDANVSGTTALVAEWIQWVSAPTKAPESPWRACVGGFLAVVALATPAACCAGRLRLDGSPRGEVVAFRPGAAYKSRRAAPGSQEVRAEPRLARCGTSFVVPASVVSLPPVLQGGSSTTLSFDVPARPADWQFRASLTRLDPGNHWRLLQLTVDVIAAAGLPPLLSARCLGGAGTPSGGGAPSPAVVITEGAGAVAASILAPSGDGRRVVRREGRSDWELQVVGSGTSGDVPSICVRRNGQDIGVSKSAGAPGRPARGALQFDVLPEANSPELPLLLMCMLAAVVFQL